MRWIALLLALLLFPQDPPHSKDKDAKGQEEALIKRVKAINQAIDWFMDPDPELREIGRKKLTELGSAAVPFIEQRLADKGYLELYKLLRDIELKGAPSSMWVEEKDLPSLEELEKELPKLSKDATDKYVYTKYYEAFVLARKGNFQRAMDIASAVVTLEPKSAYADKVRQLKRYCENMITQTTLCEAKLVQAKSVYLAGEKADVTIRLRNLWKNRITIHYDKGTKDQPGQGYAFIELSVTTLDPVPGGMENVDRRSDEVRFENEIPIALGAQWEHGFMVDTGTGLETSDIRIIELNGWTQPMKIDLGQASMAKRIFFEPAVLKVIPQKYEKDLAKPAEALARYIESGTVNDVFAMAVILEGPDKEKGLALLMTALQKQEDRRPVTARILKYMTGQKFGVDVRKWKEWYDNRGKKSPPKEK